MANCRSTTIRQSPTDKRPDRSRLRIKSDDTVRTFFDRAKRCIGNVRRLNALHVMQHSVPDVLMTAAVRLELSEPVPPWRNESHYTGSKFVSGTATELHS